MANIDDTKKPEDDMALNPVIGWQASIIYGMTCVIRLETHHSAQHLEAIFDKSEQPDVLQIAFSPEQARLLAQDLLTAADKCLHAQSDADSH